MDFDKSIKSILDFVKQNNLFWTIFYIGAIMYGKIIREQREIKQLKQKELAIILKTTQSNIGKYEREELDLNTDMIIRICRFFNITSDYLLGLEDDFGNKTYTAPTSDNRHHNVNVYNVTGNHNKF